MALAIHLLNADRESVGHATDIHDLVDRVAAERSSTLLAGADPYGDTEVARSELPRFREEWQEAKPLVASDFDEKAWEEIDAMTSRAIAEPNLHLVLVGD